MKVVLADLNDERGTALAKEIGGAYVHCDVTNTEQVIEAIEAAKMCIRDSPWGPRTTIRDRDRRSVTSCSGR